MRTLFNTAAAIAAAALAGFCGTSALIAKTAPPARTTPAVIVPHAGMPIQMILILQDAMIVRAEHARLHGP